MKGFDPLQMLTTVHTYLYYYLLNIHWWIILLIALKQAKLNVKGDDKDDNV